MLWSAMAGGGITEGLARAVKQIERAGWESASNPIPLYAHTGNILLYRRYGAVIHDIACDEDRNRRLRAISDALSRAGRHVYFVPYAGSDALGDMGYA
ncbi:MAG: hypothetical protein ACREFN_01140, partial [Acetobacteraceae bacterium]